MTYFWRDLVYPGTTVRQLNMLLYTIVIRPPQLYTTQNNIHDNESKLQKNAPVFKPYHIDSLLNVHFHFFQQLTDPFYSPRFASIGPIVFIWRMLSQIPRDRDKDEVARPSLTPLINGHQYTLLQTARHR